MTHAVEQIKRFCTRSIWIKDGAVIEDGEASRIVDLYDNFTKYGELPGEEQSDSDELKPFRTPEDVTCLAAIQRVTLNKKLFQSFEPLEVDVVYDVYQEMKDLQIGVAIYSSDRKIYVFGPNTNLDKYPLPQQAGRYQMRYRIPKLALMSGDYVIDVGIFNSDGIVNLDYRNGCKAFSVANEYFSEGMIYLEHEWDVEKLTTEEN